MHSFGTNIHASDNLLYVKCTCPRIQQDKLACHQIRRQDLHLECRSSVCSSDTERISHVVLECHLRADAGILFAKNRNKKKNISFSHTNAISNIKLYVSILTFDKAVQENK